MNRIKAMCLAAAAGTLALTGQAAFAGPVAPANWDVIKPGLGAPIAGPLVTDFISFPGLSDVGNLTSSVYLSAGIYYYELTVDPTVHENLSEFNTHSGIGGFLALAGYSYLEAATAGVGGFGINYDADASYDWMTFPDETWDQPERITFFYASTLKPGGLGAYNLIDGGVASAQGYTVVPLPAAAWAGMALMGAIGTNSIRKRRKEALC
jgi:hypothetical protein